LAPGKTKFWADFWADSATKSLLDWDFFVVEYTQFTGWILSICDIGKITFRLTMAKYLPMLPKGETVR
jgi:hypothetical protein